MEKVKKRRKTLFLLFLKQVIGIGAAAMLEMIVLILFFFSGLNAGIILPANYTENYLLQIEEQIASSQPFLEELLPPTCEYGLFDFEGNYIAGNSEHVDKLGNALKAGGYQSGYKVIKREDEYCVIKYSMEAHFSNPILYRLFPHLEMTVIALFFVLFLVTIAISAFLFGKKLRGKLVPLLDEIEHIKKKELFPASNTSDIQEFNEVLEALSEMKEALANSLKKEWETEQRRKENISALAHDIKTPLTIIKGNAELLREEENLELIYNYAAIINDNADKIEHYIRLVINETKGIDEMEAMSLSELIFNVKEQSEILCNTKQIPIVINENLLKHSEMVIEDSGRILRAVLNIVANALEYTDSQVGIQLFFEDEEQMVRIRVEDYGKGFSEEALLRATEQFYTEKRERNGAHYGLGLYFADMVAREHEGKLSIVNKEGGVGAEVTFCFRA